MLKKSLGLIAGFITIFSIGTMCQAEIIPAQGAGQIGLTAVVLGNNLALHQENNAASGTVKTLNGGDRIIVVDQKDGWAQCILSDDVNAAPEGWVSTEYIAIDPAWYHTEDVTPVYAWNDTKALKITQLEKDITLPVLKDDGQWLIVGLNGASGWIQKPAANAAAPAAQQNQTGKTDPKQTSSKPAAQTASVQGAPFTVYAEDGSSVSIQATDGNTFKDASGRSYSNTRGEYYYCIDTDILYSADPSVWTNGEPTPDDEYTGADYGEGAGEEDNWADAGNSGNGEGAGEEDNWADAGNSGNGEGAGEEDNWADYGDSGNGEGAGEEDNWAE